MKETELKPCDCAIGEWLDYEDTRIVTANELFENIKTTNRHMKEQYRVNAADYCDFRKTVNLVRFRFCPECGRKIDWKAIKRMADNEQREAD